MKFEMNNKYMFFYDDKQKSEVNEVFKEDSTQTMIGSKKKKKYRIEYIDFRHDELLL